MRHLALLRKLAIAGAVLAAGGVWANTMKASLASKEWKGLWSSAGEVRGNKIDTVARDIAFQEERREREKRLRRERLIELGLGDTLRDVRKQVLGSNGEVRGDDVERDRLPLPDGYEGYTTREMCMRQKLQFPEEFGHIDCFTKSYDGDVPWMEADGKADEDE